MQNLLTKFQTRQIWNHEQLRRRTLSSFSHCLLPLWGATVERSKFKGSLTHRSFETSHPISSVEHSEEGLCDESKGFSELQPKRKPFVEPMTRSPRQPDVTGNTELQTNFNANLGAINDWCIGSSAHNRTQMFTVRLSSNWILRSF